MYEKTRIKTSEDSNYKKKIMLTTNQLMTYKETVMCTYKIQNTINTTYLRQFLIIKV